MKNAKRTGNSAVSCELPDISAYRQHMTNLDTRLAGYHSPVLSAFRIIFGLLFTLHGSQKLFGWPLARRRRSARFRTGGPV